MSQTSPTSHEPSERVDEAQQVMKDEEERSNEAQYFTSTLHPLGGLRRANGSFDSFDSRLVNVYGCI